jgi:transposase
LQAILRAALAEIERLRLQIAGLQRHRFGRRSERLTEETVEQGVEDLEQSVAAQMAGLQAAAPTTPNSTSDPGSPPQRNRGALPGHLPRIEVVVDVADKACPCCGGTLHVIGENCAEMLDYIPAQVRVKVIRRPRYGCRACEGTVVQAAAPERPIDGGMATEALLAQVLIGKYSDHLPLYRQAQIFARQGITLDRSTLCNWVGRACWWLVPLHELMLQTVLASPLVFADDTTLPVLDPGRGRTKTGRLWTSYGLSSDKLSFGGISSEGRPRPWLQDSTVLVPSRTLRAGAKRRCRFAASWTTLARGALPAAGRDGGMSCSVEQRDSH